MLSEKHFKNMYMCQILSTFPFQITSITPVEQSEKSSGAFPQTAAAPGSAETGPTGPPVRKKKLLSFLIFKSNIPTNN